MSQIDTHGQGGGGRLHSCIGALTFNFVIETSVRLHQLWAVKPKVHDCQSFDVITALMAEG
jgi:hypothetical protein